MPHEGGLVVQEKCFTTNATLNSFAGKSASWPYSLSTDAIKQDIVTSSSKSEDFLAIKCHKEMPAEVTDEHSLSTECQEDSDDTTMSMACSDSGEDEHESEDVDMSLAKSSSSSDDGMFDDEVLKQGCPETENAKDDATQDNEKLAKLQELAMKEILMEKGRNLTPAQKRAGESMSAKLGHASNCLGCGDDVCKLIKSCEHMVQEAVEKVWNKGSDICSFQNLLEYATFLHSCSCSNQHCGVKLCAENKADILFRKSTLKSTSTFKVIFSNTSLFRKGQSVMLGKDIEIISDCELDKGAHGSVSAVHVFCPASGAQAFMALKRSIEKVKVDVLRETGYTYPAKEEAKIHSTLPLHPNILSPTLMLRNEKNGCTLIFMVLYECSLFDVYNKYCQEFNSAMPLGEALFYFNCIVKGLCSMHQSGVIHKDIKPKNVMVSSNGQVAICDFDASVIVGDELVQLNRKQGTPGYAAPEVEAMIKHGKPADIFSLFCTLLYLLVGQAQQENHQSRMKKIDMIRSSGPQYHELADLIQRGISLEPSERPTVVELKECKVLKDLMKDANCLNVQVGEEVLKKFRTFGKMRQQVQQRSPDEYINALRELPRNLPPPWIGCVSRT